MASNPNPLHTGHGAGEDPVDLSALITQTVDQYYQEQAKKAGGGTAAALTPGQRQGELPEIRMNIDGEERVFANPTEVAKFFVERDKIRQTAANAAVQTAQTIATSTNKEPAKSKKDEIKPDVRKFADLLVENPGAATEHALSEEWGIQKPGDFIKAMAQNVLQLNERLAVSEFKNLHQEYVATPENRDAMSRIIQEFNLPVNERGLELAYAVGRQRGLIKIDETGGEAGANEAMSGLGGTEPKQPQQSQQTSQWSQPYGGQQLTGREAPPHARRTGAQSSDINWDAVEDLPTGEVEKLVSQYQNLVARGLAR